MKYLIIMIKAGLPVVLLLGLVPGLLMAQTARDVLEVAVDNVDPASHTLTAGGDALDAGEFSASASIKLLFLVHDFEFAPGFFGSFDLGLQIVEGSGGGGPTVYEQNVTAGQNGNPDEQNLRLTLDQGIFLAAGRGALGDTSVGIVIQCGGDAGPCPSDDGDEIVGNIHFDGASNGKLGDSVKIQVTIRLVHPNGACLGLHNFNTDMTLAENVDGTDVVVIKNGRNAGKVNTTTPHGQISNNTLVSNVCADAESFDLLVVLDDSFRTNPHDNPGNAVFTFLSANTVDPETFDFELFGDTTPHGQLLCLKNIELAGGTSLLATVHMSIRRGTNQADLTGFEVDQAFLFAASLLEAGSDCGGTILGAADSAIEYEIK